MRSWAGTILALLVFVAALVWLAMGVHVDGGGEDSPPFHLDEAHKLGESYFYHLFFERRDLRHPAWTDDYYARINPPVGKYVFGAVLAAAGQPVRDQQLQADFNTYWRTPEELRKRVPDGMLRITRGTSIVFGAALCTLLFIIGRRVGGTAAGLIAAAMLLGYPLFVRYAQRGLTDTILLFHLTLIVPVTLAAGGMLRRHWQGTRAGGAVRRWCLLILMTAVVPGLAIALATGSKLNGGLTGPAYAAGVVLAAFVCASPRPLWRRVGLAGGVTILAAGVTLATFVAINPYLYPDPVGRMMDSMKAWTDWTVYQQIDRGFGLFTGHQKATAVGHYTLFEESLPLPRLLGLVGLGTVGAWLNVLCFGVGLVYLVARCMPGSSATSESGAAKPPANAGPVDAAVVTAWVVVVIVGITPWLPLLWDRYLMPPYLAVGLTTAIGLAHLPWAIRSVARLVIERSKARGAARVAAGALAVVTLWVVLVLTPCVIQPLLLPDPKAWIDAEAMHDPDGNQALYLHHAGLLGLQFAMHKYAVEQLEAALSHVADEPGDRPTEAAIRRCRILHDLARARVAAEDPAGAAQALRQEAAAIEKLRDAMISGDPFVRESYDFNIADCRRRAAELDHDAPPTRADRS